MMVTTCRASREGAAVAMASRLVALDARHPLGGAPLGPSGARPVGIAPASAYGFPPSGIPWNPYLATVQPTTKEAPVAKTTSNNYDRSHPIRELLDRVAMGHQPHPKELDSLHLEPKIRGLLEDLVDQVLHAKHAGENQEAERLAREYGPQLAGESPNAGDWEPPETDPAKLAAYVPR